MNLLQKSSGQKGSGSLSYIVVGILITIGVIYFYNHYSGRNHEISVRLPKVEVH